MGFFTSGTDCCTISALSETPLEHGIENLKWSSTRVITERFKRGWELSVAPLHFYAIFQSGILSVPCLLTRKARRF